MYSVDEDPNTKEKVSNRVLDISAGGVAILVPVDEGSNYTINSQLDKIRFRMRDTDIETTGKVKYIVELPTSSRMRGIKVGVEFMEVSEAAVQAIMAYILEKEVPRSNPFS